MLVRPRLLLGAALLVHGLGGGSAALAQTFASAPETLPDPVAAGAGAALAQPGVDESALRYYAAQNNRERVEAEIRRLRTLHPGWVPPKDLFTGAARANPNQDLWDLFAQDRLDLLRTEIARRQAGDAGWQPPAELLEKMARKETRLRLIQASEASRHADVIAAIETDPMLLTVADLDVLWRVAAAYAASGATAEAFDLYALALSAGEVAATDKRATAQKAVAVLPLSQSQRLLEDLRRAGATPGLDVSDVERDLARRWASDYLELRQDVAPSQAMLEILARPAGAGAEADREMINARLLGWLHRRAGRHGEALRLFEQASAGTTGAAAADALLGRALSLAGLGRGAEAEQIAGDNRQISSALEDLFIGLVAEDLTSATPRPAAEGRLEAFAEAVRNRQSAAGASALGWYAFSLKQHAAAAAWFETAVAWGGDDKAAEGHVLATLALGDRTAATALLATYTGRHPRLASLTLTAPRTGGAAPGRSGGGALAKAEKARKAGDPAGCLRLAGPVAGAEAALLRGWCLMDLDRPEEAALAFNAALSGDRKTSRDAAYGRSLAMLRVGRSFDAVEAAQSVDQPVERRQEVASAALAQAAASAFEAGNYAGTLAALDRRRLLVPEPRDLMLLRGWALIHTGQKTAAREVFTLLDRQLSSKETRAGLQELDPILVLGRE
ncbi:hypothetical protein GWI72_14325 [Microvirga tunisiensis]|uniref:Tetratricopeptide repeat protein n=1 Tax=Pannonibacter tanglangensis TaxID=2750084 RepID=A0A7X5F6J8_9HYPH|nr:hypothetical protein [Pannonibacter sp. XCT-53]NBN79449.1 hypothetical protein [Pannonibacter sp. XCT-53]